MINERMQSLAGITINEAAEPGKELIKLVPELKKWTYKNDGPTPILGLSDVNSAKFISQGNNKKYSISVFYGDPMTEIQLRYNLLGGRKPMSLKSVKGVDNKDIAKIVKDMLKQAAEDE